MKVGRNSRKLVRADMGANDAMVVRQVVHICLKRLFEKLALTSKDTRDNECIFLARCICRIQGIRP